MTAHKLIALLILVVSAPLAIAHGEIVRCESNGGRRQCRIDGPASIRIERQLSRSACLEGETWGHTRDTIWVDRGCRADFDVRSRHEETSQQRETLLCESNGPRRFCAADTFGHVELIRQLSKRACIEGETWGSNGRGIWVDGGCRAEFALGRRSGREHDYESDHHDHHDSIRTVVCESDFGHTHHCAVDRASGVDLRRQLSRTACERDRTWGRDHDGIWVSNGCRAEFTVRDR